MLDFGTLVTDIASDFETSVAQDAFEWGVEKNIESLKNNGPIMKVSREELYKLYWAEYLG